MSLTFREGTCYLDQTFGDFKYKGSLNTETKMVTSLAGLYFTNCLPPEGVAAFSTAIVSQLNHIKLITIRTGKYLIRLF